MTSPSGRGRKRSVGGWAAQGRTGRGFVHGSGFGHRRSATSCRLRVCQQGSPAMSTTALPTTHRRRVGLMRARRTAGAASAPAAEAGISVLAGGVKGLVIAGLDQLGGSVQDSTTMDLARSKAGLPWAWTWGSTPRRQPANWSATPWQRSLKRERQMTSARSWEALAVAKGRGTRLGRPREIDPPTLAGADAASRACSSLRAVAEVPTPNGISTLRGGRCWQPAAAGGLRRSAALEAGPA